MKLATLNDGSRDGALLIVSRDLRRAISAAGIARNLQAAIDDWALLRPQLEGLSEQLNAGRCAEAFDLDLKTLAAPLPRAYQFLDGSAYPAHMRAVRKARGVGMPEDFDTIPLLYQGNSDRFLAAHEPIQFLSDEGLGIDYEGEVVVITDTVPQGTTPEQAKAHIILLGLMNDTSLRQIIATEIPRGFGFMQGKPARTLGPVFVTPDEVGEAWNGELLAGRFVGAVRGETIGTLNPAEGAAFGYHQLIAHGARTRDLAAGTVLGLGALAAPEGERSHGYGCLAERRAHEQLDTGQSTTPFLRFGDDVRLEMFDAAGLSIFGAIHQRVQRL
nr:fumarylacetoacetate hydrolase family protein [uncultured Roseateles sp.]